MKYAAHDDVSVYAIGDSPEDAITIARRETRSPETLFQTAKISDELAARIDVDGWYAPSRSFGILNGFLVDTTGD